MRKVSSSSLEPSGQPAAPAPVVLNPTAAQRAWLVRGLSQPGGKLPLFDHDGLRIDPRTVRACLDAGWAEPWFRNPLKPDWLVCKLTETGRRILAETAGISAV